MTIVVSHKLTMTTFSLASLRVPDYQVVDTQSDASDRPSIRVNELVQHLITLL
jgi:hypothetical protein